MGMSYRDRSMQNRALDRFLPDYHFVERHAIRVRAPAYVVYRATREVTAAEMPLVPLLFSLRALPARLKGHRYRFASRVHQRRPLLEIVLSGNFILLADQPDREIAVGTIGRFWQLSGGGSAKVANPATFTSFADPTYAKATLDFRLEPLLDGTTRLTTETRIFTPAPSAAAPSVPRAARTGAYHSACASNAMSRLISLRKALTSERTRFERELRDRLGQS